MVLLFAILQAPTWTDSELSEYNDRMLIYFTEPQLEFKEIQTVLFLVSASLLFDPTKIIVTLFRLEFIKG